MNEGLPERKKKWTKKDYAKYFKSSDELSDYTTSKNGVVKNRYGDYFRSDETVSKPKKKRKKKSKSK